MVDPAVDVVDDKRVIRVFILDDHELVRRGADSGGQRNSRGPICSIGFLKPRRLRGRSLSSAATQSRSSAL